MKLLLDTHAFLWFLVGDESLSLKARELIEDQDNSILLSAASLWEIAIKVSIGKLSLIEPFETLIPDQLSRNSIELMPILVAHTAIVVTLPFYHRDPFDRLLIAQAIAEQMPVISIDPAFDAYPVTRLW